jgi:hypothetical protein
VIRGASLATAVALTAGTLGVFWTLQDSGPGTVVRRFHVAFRAGDARGVAATLDEPLDSPAAQSLVRFIGQVSRFGDPRILDSDRSPGQVRTLVAYPVPGGGRYPVVFVLELTNGRWRIDAAKTMTIVRDFMEGG